MGLFFFRSVALYAHFHVLKKHSSITMSPRLSTEMHATVKKIITRLYKVGKSGRRVQGTCKIGSVLKNRKRMRCGGGCIAG